MAKLTIDLARGIFEVEGSEAFVEKYFDEFRPRLQGSKQVTLTPVDKKTDPAPRTQKRTPPKRTKPAGPTETFKQFDEIPLKLKSGLAYSALKNDQDRLTWSLAFASEQEIDGFDAADILWLTDNLGAGITSNTLSIHFTRIRRKGLANRSTQTNKMRITPEGHNYLDALVTGNGTVNG